MLTLLHLDDDALFLHKCAVSFRASSLVAHIKHETANNLSDFWERFRRLQPDALLLDLSFAGSSIKGLDVLRDVRSQGYRGAVIVMSALSSTEIILECMRAGASDFLSKGLEDSELCFRIARLLQNISPLAQTKQTNATLPAHISGRALRDVQQRLVRVLHAPIRSVLVTGESGTGKEMVAELLRMQLSSGTPFISINCAALAANLIEAEIFGHEKGAFTGATQGKIGLYEAADGGWIFFDEVARLSLPAQAALLRALENGEVRPVGSTRTKRVNVRVMAATNESLERMAEKGEFRADLLSRLRGYEIALPPFRARSAEEKQDIVEALLNRLNSSLPVESQEFRITHSCAAVLCALPWQQGNIRELWQTLQAMAVDATDGVLSLELLPARLLQLSGVQAKEQMHEQNIASQEKAAAQISLPPEIEKLIQPGFPLNFENVVDGLFEYFLAELKKQTGEANLSQRNVAQMLGMTRHEATQRLARTGRQPPERG